MSGPPPKMAPETASYLKPYLDIAGVNRKSTGDISGLQPAPDLTDQALQKKRSSAMMLAGAGRGRRSTFIASAMGEPLLGKTLLGGY